MLPLIYHGGMAPGMRKGPGDAPSTEAVPPPQPHEEGLVEQISLRTVGGTEQGKIWNSAGERTLIGTDKSADLVLSDRTVSRFHCEITVRDDNVVIRDLGSRNGTIVDGTSVLAAHLRHGAVLTLGKTQLRFEVGRGQVRIPLSEQQSFGRMVGASQSMRAVFAVLERAAQTNATVLLMGETGTGKDIAAEMLHTQGSRASGPFAVVDCGAVPPNLLESELFGHEKGAFTGADRMRIGAFETANGGTLFLDEIGELSPDLQPKLLRVLESRQVQRVGGNQRIPVDVRVIAATSRNLWAEVNSRRFRLDLYYRLAVIMVTLPPLRERPEDLPLLVDALLTHMGVAQDPSAAPLRSAAFLTELVRHPWPGNVRELRNYLERCLALDQQVPIDEHGDETIPTIDPKQTLQAARERWVRTFEKQYAAALLLAHDNNVAAAARTAGVDRTSFYRLLLRCGLDLPRKS